MLQYIKVEGEIWASSTQTFQALTKNFTFTEYDATELRNKFISLYKYTTSPDSFLFVWIYSIISDVITPIFLIYSKSVP
jgi:hypothetical protein